MHRSISDNKVSEKFSVDTILDSQKVYRKRRRDEEMDDDSHSEDVIGLQTKKPNLKFGIDAILNDNSEEQHSPPVITDSSSLKSSHCQTSGPLQSEHCFGRNPSTVCYESQCFATAMNTMNKPLASGYQLYYYPYASVNPIAINNIGEGYGLAYNPSYGYTGYTTFNQSSVKSGDQCSSQSAKSKKAKWNRAVFTNLQRKGLEKRFSFQKYITKPDRRKLAESLNLSDSQVKVWFQNRRMKWRHSKEYREELSKTASNKEQQLISNFPVNKSDESTQNAN